MAGVLAHVYYQRVRGSSSSRSPSAPPGQRRGEQCRERGSRGSRMQGGPFSQAPTLLSTAGSCCPSSSHSLLCLLMGCLQHGSQEGKRPREVGWSLCPSKEKWSMDPAVRHPRGWARATCQTTDSTRPRLPAWARMKGPVRSSPTRCPLNQGFKVTARLILSW